jgi:hypothetical protein
MIGESRENAQLRTVGFKYNTTSKEWVIQSFLVLPLLSGLPLRKAPWVRVRDDH